MPTDAPPFRLDTSTLTLGGTDLSSYIRRVRFREDVAQNDIPTLANPGQQDVGTIRYRCQLDFWISYDIDGGAEGVVEKLEALADPTTFQTLVYTPVAGVTYTAQAKFPYVPAGEYDPGENVEISVDCPLQGKPVYANTATPAA